ncbi:DUF3833 domain-containing protein [Shewanella sp. 1_MG-2023]|uniref:DUF3833 domain-containing protein n=1 Tax=unclassified Shewanella TaxID=196818 RepID=UPI0026E441F3|nr:MULTISPECIES: DUF3833 domain-containing protein [unclassified Shewanella]MDO6609958.1 DUF3833 domain-containing protein [Shewanella sp. 7_MG-2023]MDO6769900.1 DUF3833 domain-containing protein [Shewanella sp. 2_MG-2023]MDO6792964.1 DUF3833 domain-containing protein [Shewanella sp. 1_MG-2023]
MGLLSKIKSYFLVVIAGLVLMSCSSASIEDYDKTTPVLNLKTFFDGQLTASGIVQDYSGTVTRKFTVTMEASWQGDEGVINEWFIYDDGEKQTRIWKITDLGNGKYQGTANDILGIAEGEARGIALRWAYDMNLVVDDSEYEVHFDDWMFLVDENTIINKSDIIKFGITVAEVTLVIQKVN